MNPSSDIQYYNFELSLIFKSVLNADCILLLAAELVRDSDVYFKLANGVLNSFYSGNLISYNTWIFSRAIEFREPIVTIDNDNIAAHVYGVLKYISLNASYKRVCYCQNPTSFHTPIISTESTDGPGELLWITIKCPNCYHPW